MWNWQLLVWLAPATLLGWAIWMAVRRWRAGREEPWQAILAWGNRIGKPIGESETVLEYGTGLADYVVEHQRHEQDAARIVAREVRAISDSIATLRYGPESGRLRAADRVGTHWRRLRQYLPRVRLSRHTG